MWTGMIFYRDASLGPVRRSYDAASYITLWSLTKDSWRDGSLQDRIIWVVICRRRCWFFGCVCCHVRVRPPAATDPPGISWALLSLASASLPLLSCVSPRRTTRRMIFFISSYFAVALVLLSLPLYPDTSLSSLSIFNLLSHIPILGCYGRRRRIMRI